MIFTRTQLGLVCSILGMGVVGLQADDPVIPPLAPPVPAPARQAATPVAPIAGAPTVVTTAPKLVFETPSWDFGKGRAGESLKHTFIFTNIGNAPLEITAVRPGCGCTAAGEWTRKVEPGKTGTIPVQINLGATWPAGPTMKNVTVDSNDRSQPSVQLQIKGMVWKPVEVNPAFAVLNIPADAPRASTVVRITSNLEEPLKLETPQSNNKSFTLELRETKPGKEFELLVTATPPLANNQGQITIKTSSTNVPEVALTAWANVQPAIAIMPPAITLPPGPLANKSTPTINIQNNGTNTLQLSDATLTGIPELFDTDVKIQESVPGKMFAVTVAFPQGFTIPQGQHLELSMKSTHPQYPVIKIPVNQIPGAGNQPIVPVKPAPTSAIPQPPRTGQTAAK